MLTEVIGKLDRAVLELALKDAFCDLSFYEGEEITTKLEEYLTCVENKTNTEEQNNEFFELAMPYIEHSVMKYGSYLLEGLKEGGKPGTFAANDSKGKVGLVPAEKTKLILGKESKAAYESELTEAEETQIWDDIYEAIFSAAKAGVAKAKTSLVKTGEKLKKSTLGALSASAKNFKKNLAGFKLPKGETPNPTANK
jgi:hypothetical protein